MATIIFERQDFFGFGLIVAFWVRVKITSFPAEEYLFLNRRGAENAERGVSYYK
jgi:hypothetical protein